MSRELPVLPELSPPIEHTWHVLDKDDAKPTAMAIEQGFGAEPVTATFAIAAVLLWLLSQAL